MKTIKHFVLSTMVAFKKEYPAAFDTGAMSGTHLLIVAMHDGCISLAGTMPQTEVKEFVRLALESKGEAI